MAVSKNAAGYSGLTEDEEKQLKALLNKAPQAPKAFGGSASKRLRGESDSDFEAVGSPTTPSELFRSEDRKEVPLPKNCTLKEWSHTVCQLPKVNGEPKWNGKTYSELLRMAIDGDIELDKYLGFNFTFSRSIMGPMMELTSLKPWTWLGFFSIWSLILRESQLVLGRE